MWTKRVYPIILVDSIKDWGFVIPTNKDRALCDMNFRIFVVILFEIYVDG